MKIGKLTLNIFEILAHLAIAGIIVSAVVV